MNRGELLRIALWVPGALAVIAFILLALRFWSPPSGISPITRAAGLVDLAGVAARCTDIGAMEWTAGFRRARRCTVNTSTGIAATEADARGRIRYAMQRWTMPDPEAAGRIVGKVERLMNAVDAHPLPCRSARVALQNVVNLRGWDGPEFQAVLLQYPTAGGAQILQLEVNRAGFSACQPQPTSHD